MIALFLYDADFLHNLLYNKSNHWNLGIKVRFRRYLSALAKCLHKNKAIIDSRLPSGTIEAHGETHSTVTRSTAAAESSHRTAYTVKGAPTSQRASGRPSKPACSASEPVGLSCPRLASSHAHHHCHPANHTTPCPSAH